MKSLGTPPFVCLITTGEANSENYRLRSSGILDTVRSAVEDGVSLVQIREKLLPARFQYELARDAVEIARGSQTLIVINDRADIAIAAGADGVHLPENSLRPDTVRKLFGASLIVGRSVHAELGAIEGEHEGAD